MFVPRNHRRQHVARNPITERPRESANDERPTLRQTSRFRDHDDEEPDRTVPSTARYAHSG
jgi:hypothetical protein